MLDQMLTEQDNEQLCMSANATQKLRTACENCRQSKVKCNLAGKNSCTRCLRHGLQCRYGFANRSGKPKGSKNRATLKKLGRLHDGKKSTGVVVGEGSCGLFVVETSPVVVEQNGGNDMSLGVNMNSIDEDVRAASFDRDCADSFFDYAGC